jgi:hypothetical protein
MSSGSPAGFVESEPTLESCWRSIILFGRDVASYKLALGRRLLPRGRTLRTPSRTPAGRASLSSDRRPDYFYGPAGSDL